VLVVDFDYHQGNGTQAAMAALLKMQNPIPRAGSA
jgi:acetoin utilization deacetylase AcuC-like enzyme